MLVFKCNVVNILYLQSDKLLMSNSIIMSNSIVMGCNMLIRFFNTGLLLVLKQNWYSSKKSYYLRVNCFLQYTKKLHGINHKIW